MRATNHKHYGRENGKAKAKTRKGFKAASFTFAIVAAAAALIVPTTTLAPGVDAYEDSRVASYSVGDINKFSVAITNNCVEVTTAPATEKPTAVEETTIEETKAEDTTAAVEEEEILEESEPQTEEISEPEQIESTVVSSEKDDKQSQSSNDTASSESYDNSVPYSGNALIQISTPDPNYNPGYVSLSAYDRAKLERLVMGEAGTMGYEGCALVAQCIRDAMNRSGTSSIDTIISEYQYYGSTAIEPNQNVKNAVSYIFDQNGSAVQHRLLCFYIGYSSWHETQTFITSIGGVRFFDLNY